MSNRERWIVYPLLFFSIALGWKSVARTDGSAQFKTIECERIDVGISKNKPSVRIIGQAETGSITVFGKDGFPLTVLGTDLNGTGGSIVLSNPLKLSKVAVDATDDGGQIRLSSNPTKPEVVLGFDANVDAAGLIAFNPKKEICQTQYLPNGLRFLTEADRRRIDSEKTAGP